MIVRAYPCGKLPLINTECGVQFDCLQHLCRRDKNGARAQYEKDFANVAGILDEIILSAFHRAQAKRVGYQEDLQFGLDCEQASDRFHS